MIIRIIFVSLVSFLLIAENLTEEENQNCAQRNPSECETIQNSSTLFENDIHSPSMNPDTNFKPLGLSDLEDEEEADFEYSVDDIVPSKKSVDTDISDSENFDGSNWE